jgi:hypothetical protein
MSAQKKVGCPLGTRNSRRLEFVSPEMMQKQLGNLVICSDRIVRKGRDRPYVTVRCIECGVESEKDFDSVRTSKAGCRKCGRKKNRSKPCLGVPRWLLMRCISAKERCTNPNSRSWKNYGGRGIQFGFDSPSLMGTYLMENCSITRELEIDRIDNNCGYCPGNLRAVRRKVNANNRRGSGGVRRMHKFRTLHPEIMYADSTLCTLLRTMTFKEVVQRYHMKSDKPKGVFGTYSTADQDIASLVKDF